jgi:hypothetical protein
MVIWMNKPKIVVLAVALAAIATLVIVGAAYAQTANLNSGAHSQVSSGYTPGLGYGPSSGFGCPSYGAMQSYGNNGAPQNGYPVGPRMGMRGGMMGGYYP